MKLLPADFEITRYGVTVRLVTETDAEFITQLRSDKRLGRYIHSSDGDVEKQIQWTREYKKREIQGTDYYFIFSVGNIPQGLCRIYNINDNYGTVGSWICRPDIEQNVPVLTLILTRDILFDILQLDIDYFDVRKDNKKVLRCHELFGAEKIGEDGDDLLFKLEKSIYLEKRDILLKFYL